MTITANVGIGVISLAASDNTVLNPTGTVVRDGIQGLVAYNTTGGAIGLTFYESPDLTSASGDLISANSVGPGASLAITELEGQGFEVGQNLIVVASGTGCNLKTTVTRTET